MTLRPSTSLPMPVDTTSWFCSHCKYDLVPGEVHLLERSLNGLPVLRMWLCDRCWTTIWKRDLADPGEWTSNESFYGRAYDDLLQAGEVQTCEGRPGPSQAPGPR
jgi:hypothetical protein